MTRTLVLRGIEKHFGSTRVVCGVDLSIERGERHALIGPNGAGKSTLFNLIAGALRPSAGGIEFNGVDITGRSSHAIGRLGLARSFQTTSVFAGLSVLDNLRCAAHSGLHGLARWRHYLSDSRDADEHAHRVLEALGLAGCAHALAGSLSYAQQRALDLGIALASGATTLLVDEPTAGMNRDEAHRAIELIRTATVGKTLLMVEHDMAAVFGLADHISVLVGGRILATGTPEAIRADAAVRAAYLGEVRTP